MIIIMTFSADIETYTSVELLVVSRMVFSQIVQMLWKTRVTAGHAFKLRSAGHSGHFFSLHHISHRLLEP